MPRSSIWYLCASTHSTTVTGRAGRLLEKWLLSDNLGAMAWYIQSERHYYQHVDAYYRNLNRLGIFYEQPDFTKAEPFLKILREAL